MCRKLARNHKVKTRNSANVNHFFSIFFQICPRPEVNNGVHILKSQDINLRQFAKLSSNFERPITRVMGLRYGMIIAGGKSHCSSTRDQHVRLHNEEKYYKDRTFLLVPLRTDPK